MKLVRLALGCLIVLALSACGTAGFSYKEESRALKGVTVVLITPQIQLYEIGVGQQRSRRADLEASAVKAAETGAREFAAESGWFKVVPMPKLTDEEQYDFDQRMAVLQANQLEYSKVKEQKGSVLGELEERLDVRIGPAPVLAKVAATTGATYGLLVAGSDSFTTPAAKLVSLASAVVTLGNTPLALTGIGNLSLSVVNLSTGRVIWMADDTTKKDLTDGGSHKSMFKTLLRRSPLGD